MNYETFIDENIKEVSNRFNDVINSFKSLNKQIDFDYIKKLSDEIDILEITNEKEYHIKSFIFEKILSDMENINNSLLAPVTAQSKIIEIDNKDLKSLFKSSILEGLTSDKHTKSKSHLQYLNYVDSNKDLLQTHLDKYISTLKTNKKVIDKDVLEKLESWTFETFNTPKFFIRKFIYLYVLKNKSMINTSINPNYQEKNILEELLNEA